MGHMVATMATRSDRARRPLLDALLVVGASFIMAVGTVIVSDHSPPGVAGWLLLLGSAAALWWRRERPVLVMWITIALGLVYHLFAFPGAFYTLAIVVGVYSAAAAGERLMSLVGVVAALGLFLVADSLFPTGHDFLGGGALWFGGWLAAGAVLGEAMRSRADYLAASEARAREAERHRQEEALRRVSEERVRIARDLHDVLAHSISIINVQAGAAAHHLDNDPDKSRDALNTVRETGKQALRELRSAISVLRDGIQLEAPRSPSPGVADLDRLVETTRETGLEVDLHRRGDLTDLPADVELAVYRVVQESLTNVTRHAHATKAEVTIESRAVGLFLRIDDNGRGPTSADRVGHGISGMRERVRALGGRLEAGSRPGSGFRVEAEIPLETPS